MVLLPLLMASSRSSVSSLFLARDFSQRLLWAASSFSSCRNMSIIFSMAVMTLLKCPPERTSKASLASLKLCMLFATPESLRKASSRWPTAEALLLRDDNWTNDSAEASKVFVLSGSERIWTAFAMPANSSVRTRVLSAHCSAFSLQPTFVSWKSASSSFSCRFVSSTNSLSSACSLVLLASSLSVCCSVSSKVFSSAFFVSMSRSKDPWDLASSAFAFSKLAMKESYMPLRMPPI
mmetsp:Transcript_9013/g.25894  ORF Transcript_9013/g.25894 Transcript_9013/m.25894 type:complete len:236 (-) Transcript_9013:640-1347(-)